ncbi:anaphase promoting complex subunit 4, partial [Nannochloropsis gaditana CCMP526]|uniref:anaphase promoting complex subunit 4 n=1 Tax=Nannochloropsis gaditana (strain CCMP526) TaxID=1093141 RepID=UPI00029F653C
PKMDLIALLRTDGSVVVLRTISWQRLNTLPAATLQDEKRVTAMSWSPDGNVLALGHAQGAISFLDVEKGERARQPLGARPASAVQQGVEALQWFTQQREPATMSSEDWEKNLTQAAGKYYLDRDAVFWEELPPLGLQSGSFA